MEPFIQKIGYGHWKITVLYYGKEISCTSTDSESVDDYYSGEDEKDGRVLRWKRGYKSLMDEVIRKYKGQY